MCVHSAHEHTHVYIQEHTHTHKHAEFLGIEALPFTPFPYVLLLAFASIPQWKTLCLFDETKIK